MASPPHEISNQINNIAEALAVGIFFELYSRIFREKLSIQAKILNSWSAEIHYFLATTAKISVGNGKAIAVNRLELLNR
jgi:methyltransferase-like protein